MTAMQTTALTAATLKIIHVYSVQQRLVGYILCPVIHQTTLLTQYAKTQRITSIMEFKYTNII